MSTLIENLEQWASSHGEDVTVVFEHPLSPPLESSVITIAHAPKAAANSADDQIVAMVQTAENPQDIRVATSDRTLSQRVGALGAAVYPAQRLRDLIDPR